MDPPCPAVSDKIPDHPLGFEGSNVGVIGSDPEVTASHPYQALSAAKVRGLSKPGRYAHGNCLYLLVDDSGSEIGMF